MPRPVLLDLSETHRRIARAVGELEKTGRPAFVPDLVKALELARQSSLMPTLRIMERNGFVELHGHGGEGQRRTQVVKLTSKGSHAVGLGGLPLLGSIPAGLLAEALRHPEEVVEPAHVLPWRPNDFLLRVRGESMIGEGILDGDLVLLRPNVVAPNGTIAAVCVGDEQEATLKRVYLEGDKVRLRAANPAFPDVVVRAEEVRLAGIFKGLVRHVGGPA